MRRVTQGDFAGQGYFFAVGETLTGVQIVAVEMENLLCEEVVEQQTVRSRADCVSHS